MDDQFEPDHMDREQHERQAREGGQDGEHHDREVERDQIQEGPLNVLENVASFAHRRHDRREVVVQQHKIRRGSRDIGAALAHGDPDVRAP